MILPVYSLLFFFLLAKIVHGCDLFLLGLVSLALELFHEFDLIGKSLSPELLSFIVLDLPVGQFLLQFLDVVVMGVVNSHVILFFFFRQIHLSLGLEFAHLVI